MTKESKNQGLVYDAFDLVKFTWEKKWILIAITFVAFVASIIVSLLITPRFKSQVVLFPAASVSVSKDLVETSSINMEIRDVLSFGKEDEAERLLQILHSNQIKDHVVNKYHLMDHYHIKMSSRYPYTQLDKKFQSNIKFRRTEFLSIEITVLDEAPKFAADIANDIANYIDSTMHIMQRERAKEALNIVEKEYISTQKEINLLNDSLQKIRRLGIIDYQSQATSLNDAYATAIEKGNNSAANALSKKMDLLAKYGGSYIEISKTLESELERLGQLKVKYASARVNVEQTLPQIFIVDKAVESEKKDVPKRALIVLMSTISTFALALLLLLIIDNIKARS
jgi:uncharacterized protein involved in exopolysaccharide biosynthesis